MASKSSVHAPTNMSRIIIIGLPWLAMLFASSLLFIFLGDEKTRLYPFVLSVQLGGLLLLLLLTYVWSACREFRRVFLALFFFALGWRALLPLAFNTLSLTPFWKTGSSSQMQLIISQLLRWIPALLMSLTLIGSGITRDQLFLKRGNLLTPIVLNKRLKIRINWLQFTLVFLIVAGLVLPLYLVSTLHPASIWSLTLLTLPAIALSALLNSFHEEFEFRSLLFAHLIPILGQNQALWLTTILFGLGHFYGQPSGAIGVLLGGLAGLIWGLSMLKTKGFGFAWVTHFVQDATIFSLLLLK